MVKSFWLVFQKLNMANIIFAVLAVKANGKVKFFELLDERPEIRQAIVDQLLGNNNGGIEDGSEDNQ